MIHRTLDGRPLWGSDTHRIVVEAVKSGLLDMSEAEFYDRLGDCVTPNDRDDFIQELWDRL